MEKNVIPIRRDKSSGLRELNEHGMVLVGDKLTDTEPPQKLEEIINRTTLSSEIRQEIKEFDNLKPEAKKALLKELINLDLETQIQYISSRGEGNMESFSLRLDKYCEIATAKNIPELMEFIERPEGRDVRLGIVRDVISYFMDGTVEKRAYMRARSRVERKNSRDSRLDEYIEFIPPIKGYYSGVFIDRDGDSLNYSIGVWEDLINLVESVDYHSQRELSFDQLAQKASRTIELSTEYNPPDRSPHSPYASSFDEQLAWAQLHTDAREKIWWLHNVKRLNFPGLRNFIGKSAPNPYSAALHAANKHRERMLLAYEKNTANVDLLTAIHDEDKNIAELRAKHESKKSILDQALSLAAAGGENGWDMSWFDRSVKTGDIRWAHNALRHNLDYQTVKSYTRVHRAVEDYGEAYGIQGLTRDLFELASQVYSYSGQGLNIDPIVFDLILKGYNLVKHNFPDDNEAFQDMGHVLSAASTDSSSFLELIISREDLNFLAYNEWFLKSFGNAEILEMFPHHAPFSKQVEWIIQHSEPLPRGLDQNHLAKFILRRLRQGIDANLHDATYWLGEFEAEWARDSSIQQRLERDLIVSLIRCQDQRQISKFPSNINRLKDLITDEKVLANYLKLLDKKKQDSSFGLSNADVAELSDIITREHLLDVETPTFNVALEKLKRAAEERLRVSNDTMRWLSSHGDTPRGVLVRAWQNRPQALSEGCADNPRAILAWAELNALRSAIAEGKVSFTNQDLVDNKDFFGELSGKYGPAKIDKAFRWYQSRTAEQLLPPDSVVTQDGYRLDVLSKDDARGFTIGYDTGCCMTIGGESDSCIKAGYRHADCGFIALYGPDGNIRAQSFWYVNPESPGTLVLDNIEANEGRDLNRIIEFYKNLLTQYLGNHPELEIRTVHVGEGYTDVSLGGLESVHSINNPHSNVYTDARRQRRLV